MKEFQFIDSLKRLSPFSPPGGIGDDAALFKNTLIAKDIMAEGVHFLDNEPLDDVVDRLFASNVSDICAMGGRRGGYAALLGLAVPEYVNKEALVRAVEKACSKYSVRLIGGDTTSARRDLFMSLTIIGMPGKYVLCRSGAKSGDLIYLSRALGASKYILECRLGGQKPVAGITTDFSPEDKIGELLGSIDGVTACIDISDGLGADLRHIADASKVGLRLYYERIPPCDLPFDTEKSIEYALSSGEEYALAFTVNRDLAPLLVNTVFEKTGRHLHLVGEVYKGQGVRLEHGSQSRDIARMGYEHLG